MHQDRCKGTFREPDFGYQGVMLHKRGITSLPGGAVFNQLEKKKSMKELHLPGGWQ